MVASRAGGPALAAADADIPADAGTDATLLPGVTVQGDFEDGYDQDWYRFEASAGSTYRFSLGGEIWASLDLVDADGNILASGDGTVLVWSSAAPGAVFVVAGSDSEDGDLRYSLAAEEVLDAVRGSVLTQAALPVGGTLRDTIDYGGDTDWFRVDVQAGVTYRFSLQSVAAGDATLGAPSLVLRDRDGNEIDGSSGDPYGELSLGFTAGSDGPVYLDVGADSYWDFDGREYPPTGDYVLSAFDFPGDVPGSGLTEASIALGETVAGRVEFDGDSDWYRVSLESGRTYVVDLAILEATDDRFFAQYLRLLDADGNELRGASTDERGLAQLGYLSGFDGQAFLSVRSRAAGTYQLSVHEIVGDIADSTETAASLAAGTAIAGVTDYARDSDWYRVQVVAGRTYRFDLQGVDTGAGTASDPGLALHDADGGQLFGSDTGGEGRDARLGFTARSDGEVFVEAAGERSGTYRLSVVEVAGDQPDNTDTPATLAAGGIAHGTIDWAGEAPDRDWYRLELTAGHTYRVDLEGRGSGAGSLLDPQLLLLDAAGDPVPAIGQPGEGWNDSLIVRAASDATIFAAISGSTGSEDPNGGTGTYRLSMTEVDDPVGDGTGTGAVLPIGSWISGQTEFDEDHDWYRFDAQAGVAYVLALATSRQDGSGGGMEVSLRDASGQNLGDPVSTSDAAAVELGFTARADGDLFVDVRGIGAGTYRLLVAPFIGDVPDSELTQASLAVDEAVAGTIDWAGGVRDADWYRVEVVAGRTYVVTMEGAASGAGTLQAPYLNLAGADGDWRDAQQIDGTATLSFRATRDDTVFAVASGYGEDEDGFSGPLVGSYRLTLREIDNDIADDILTAAALSVGQVVDGTFDFVEDRDRYHVEVVAGRTYVFDLAEVSSGEGNGAAAYLILYDSEGNYLRDTSSGQQPGLRLGWTADSDGTVYIETVGSVAGGYSLGLSELAGDVPDSVDGAATLELGRATTGVVDYDGDEDLFRFEAQAGHTYRVLLAGRDSAAGTLASPRLWLVDGEGASRSGYPASGDSADQALGITADADGLVVIGASGAETGTYSLTIVDLPSDVLASTATTATLSAGGSVDGVIDVGDDRDWYRFEAVAGSTYYVELDAAGIDAMAVEGIGLRVLDAAGDLAAVSLSWASDTILRAGFRAATGGDCYIEVEGQTFLDSAANIDRAPLGSYHLALDDLPEEAGEDADEALALAPDTTTRASIQWRGDSDWYRIDAVAGESYVIDVVGIGTEALPSAEVTLYDNGGNSQVSSIRDSTPNHLRVGFTATENDSFYIQIDGKDYYPYDGGWDYVTGNYEIDISRIEDVPDTASSTAILQLDVTRADVLDYPDDSDCYHLRVSSGTTYTIRLEDTSAGSMELPGPAVIVQDSRTGQYLHDSDGRTGTASDLSFTANDDGEVLVFVKGIGSPSGSYRLTASELAGDVAGDGSSDVRLGLQAPVDSSVDFAGDKDAFRLSVEAGRTYRIDLEGAASGGGTLTNTALSLRYAGGIDIRHDEGGGVGGNSRIEFTPTLDGEVLVIAGGAGNDRNTGSYSLTVSSGPPALIDDLPSLVDGSSLPDAAVQLDRYDNGPEAGGEVFATWLGGSGRLDSAVGAFRPDRFAGGDPQIVFASTAELTAGATVPLGQVGLDATLGLFLMPGTTGLDAELAGLRPGSLALIDAADGEPFSIEQLASPRLIRTDGLYPVVVADDLLFAVGGHGSNPGAPVPNILNPGGFAQATVGSFWRDGIELCRVIAFEETAFAGGQSDGDFDDAVLALSVGRLNDDDVAAIRDALFA